jgi:hypothetical protein
LLTNAGLPSATRRGKGSAGTIQRIGIWRFKETQCVKEPGTNRRVPRKRSDLVGVHRASRLGELRELEAFLGRHEFEIWVFDFDRDRRLVDSVEVSVMWS